VTENGFPVENEASFTREEAINDVQRQTYYAGYLREFFEASKDDGIKIGGYFAWSLLE
jgi:beta-glucosidase